MGIAGVRLSPGRPIVVYLDSHVELSRGEGYPLAWHALDRLLPYVGGADIQVNGVLGLRIAAIRENDLHLTLAETASRLILRGVPGTRWEDYLDERWKSMATTHDLPQWKSSSFTDYERQDEQSHPLVRGMEKDIAWVGAGLLRRIALFHTSSSAYSTRSWMSGSEWIFELDTRRDVRLDHDTLLARLTDPVWGLPLRIIDHHCTCDGPPLENDHIRQCTYDMAHSDGPGPGLQFRFRWGRAVYDKDARGQLQRLGADTGWLNRVLPTGTQGSRGEVAS
ncbi:hypothetical protein ACH47Z_23595 [Streptomyces sp. NPDC020192]|uniref:hypothetical protein n=1 Tax=Streptomyces sp. NPDC020192 TaxID=3365066 RepID=UPI00378E5300